MQKFLIVNQLDNRTAEILIYGYIGNDVISGDFLRELKQLENVNDTIHIRINSGGGSVFEGLAIFNAIKNCNAETIGYIDGIAASMGSVIAMACNKVHMSKVAMFMTHKAKMLSHGNANDMRNSASLMDSLETAICTIYAGKTGLTVDQVKAKYLTGEDRWLTAEEALSEKIIDGIYDAKNVKAPPATMRSDKELVGYFNTEMNFNYSTNNNMKKITLSPDQYGKLNLPVNADDTAVQNALDAVFIKAANADNLQVQLSTATTAKTTAETALKTFKEAAAKTEIDSIVSAGLTAKKFTKEVGDSLKVDYASNPTGLKTLVDGMTPHISISQKLKTDEGKLKELADKTWDELDKVDGALMI